MHTTLVTAMQYDTNLKRILSLFSLCTLVLLQSASAQKQTIDFEDLLEGQVVSSVNADGGFGPVSVFGLNDRYEDLNPGSNVNSAVIFDSDCDPNCTGGDKDLGSPNETFGGPGEGAGGEMGSTYENFATLGNILIIHERPGEISNVPLGIPGVAAPDDETRSSSITIIFPEPVIMYSFDMIDRESNETQNVVLFGEGDVELGMFDTPSTDDNGYATIKTDIGTEDLGTEGVVKMVMNHRGSGGLDNIVFAPPPPPPPPGGGCSYTIGFWKTHPEVWPVDNLDLGSGNYDADALMTILNTEPKGDKSLILAHQLIATKLNVANGADPTDLGTAIADADAWLTTYGIGDGQKKWEGGEETKNTLDGFNNGLIGPGHCDATSKTVKRRGNASSPDSFKLISSYPNPFNPQTTITFNLATRSNVRLTVHDMLGRELEVLIQGNLDAGSYEAIFDAGNLPSGTYLYRLITPAGVVTGKMILAK